MAKKTEKLRNSARRMTDGKRGFTLVELVVVMALLAILTAMIVSFSVLVSGYAKDGRAVVDHTEDCATAKEAVIAYVRARDVADNTFTYSDGTSVFFGADVLSASGESLTGLDTLERITFDQSGKLLRCTLHPKDTEAFDPFVFVLSLRYAGLKQEGEGS